MRVRQIQYNGGMVDANGSDILFFCREPIEDAIFNDIETAFREDDISIVVPRVTGKESFYVNPITLDPECVTFDGFAIRSDVFDRLGGFDDRLGEAAACDLYWRAKQAGHKGIHASSIVLRSKKIEEDNEERLIESLLMRCKHGRFSDVWEGKKLILKAIKHPALYKVARGSLIKKSFFCFPKAFGYFLKRKKNDGHVSFHGVDFGFSRGIDIGEPPTGVPLVSLVVRTYKRPERLRETLYSLRNQTYKNFEVVVVEDDAPHLDEILKEFCDLNIRYIALGENRGRAAAGNEGFIAAKGRYLNLLDDDDLLFPEYLETAIAAMERENADIVFSRAVALKIDVKSESPYRFVVRDRQLMDFPRVDVFSMVRQCLAASNGVLFKKELLNESGVMRPELKGHEDWSLWLRLMAKGKWTVQPFAACCFTVPHDDDKERKRRAEYSENDELLLEDEALRYAVTAKELKAYYDNTIHDFMYLKQLGKLDEFIDSEYEKITREN